MYSCHVCVSRCEYLHISFTGTSEAIALYVNPSNMFEMQISSVRLGERMCMYLHRSAGDTEVKGYYTHF